MATKKKSKKVNRKKILKEHSHFIAILVLFAGFSIYSLASFFSSNTTYIDHYYASVSDVPAAEEQSVETAEVDSYSYFNDVEDDHPHIVAVTELLNAGVLEGYPDGSFRPDEPITRAGLLKVLVTATDADLGGRDLDECFTDVNGDWYAPFVCYAKEEGWVSGYADGSYKPGEAATRGAALKIAMEALDYDVCETVDTRSFDDVEKSSWLAPYVCAAKRDGITSSSGMFYPNDQMTRAQFAQILYNMMSEKGMI